MEDSGDEDDGMVSAMIKTPSDASLRTFLESLKPLELTYMKLLNKVFRIPVSDSQLS